MVHCLVFELFQTTIGIGSTPCIETDIIGIKCQSRQVALLHKFLLKSNKKIEQQGQGKFIPAGLASIIGTEPMQTIICKNNQYLKTITSIPINGLPPVALHTVISIEDGTNKKDQENMTVRDYFLSAKWCHGLEPMDHKGRYLLITTYQELSEACKWLDENLEELFTEYIPQHHTIPPIAGYDFPKQGDKPCISHQLGMYADQL